MTTVATSIATSGPAGQDSFWVDWPTWETFITDDEDWDASDCDRYLQETLEVAGVLSMVSDAPRQTIIFHQG